MSYKTRTNVVPLNVINRCGSSQNIKLKIFRSFKIKRLRTTFGRRLLELGWRRNSKRYQQV